MIRRFFAARTEAPRADAPRDDTAAAIHALNAEFLGRQAERSRQWRDALDALTAEVAALSAIVAQLVPPPLPLEQEGAAPDDIAPPIVPDFAPEVGAPTLRAILRARRRREQFFAPGTFADPAWDIMLELALANLLGQDISVSALCIAAAVPPTTALRWITQLTAEGILVREPDPRDARRIFIRLSAPGRRRVFDCLAATGPLVR